LREADLFEKKPIGREDLWQAIDQCVPSPSVSPRETHTNGRADPTLDRTMFLARVGGNVELLKEILQLFRGECPRLLEEFHQAVSHRNAERVQQTAHTLKGSLGLLSASDASEAALRLEELGVGGDLAEVDNAFTSLRHRIGLLDLAITRFENDLRS
jgi:HPt (histidine-containing phosphotransfer) domain-containing protein